MRIHQLMKFQSTSWPCSHVRPKIIFYTCSVTSSLMVTGFLFMVPLNFVSPMTGILLTLAAHRSDLDGWSIFPGTTSNGKFETSLPVPSRHVHVLPFPSISMFDSRVTSGCSASNALTSSFLLTSVAMAEAALFAQSRTKWHFCWHL